MVFPAACRASLLLFYWAYISDRCLRGFLTLVLEKTHLLFNNRAMFNITNLSFMFNCFASTTISCISEGNDEIGISFTALEPVTRYSTDTPRAFAMLTAVSTEGEYPRFPR